MDPQGRDRAVYIISVAAELTGVHPQTLRVYERKGLVEPARTGGMSRRYSDADIERIQRIQELTSEGLNLAGVHRVLELENEIAHLREQLRQVARVADSKRRDLVPLRQEIVVFEDRSGG
jgi:MerR family transcriptional regulator/heat shock protein HspR